LTLMVTREQSINILTVEYTNAPYPRMPGMRGIKGTNPLCCQCVCARRHRGTARLHRFHP
jgi:hypothetical protein